MSRVTHIKHQPMNTEFWDYYILCHLDADVAITLQRMEFWDGTKDDGNTHAEEMNDALIKSGQTPTQDTSYWIYKAQDELQWEIMGVAGERRLGKIVNILVDQLHYLAQRNNPLEGWDRKKQYEFQASVLQEHIDYLGYIVGYFNLPLKHLRPVFCAIEALTRCKVYIDTLSVEKVLEKIEDFKEDPKTPHFLKEAIEKFDKHFLKPPVRSFRTLTEWKAQKCGLHSADLRNASRESAECNPQKCGSNSIRDYIGNNINNSHKEESITDHLQNSNTSPNGDTLSLLQEITNRFGGVEQVRSLLEKLSTQSQQLPTSNTQDKPTSTEADEQASYSHPATQNELPGTPVKEPIQQDTLLPKEEKPTIPVMPPTTAKWCPETAIQIVEAKLGKYYRQVARDKELGFARRMFKEDSELTREQFEAAYDKRNDKWWHDHKGLLHLHHMIEKDRIHEMLDKIEVESIGEYHGNKRIISFPVITQPQKQLVAAGTGFFTEGVLAGQPDYHADPWA